MSFEIKDGITYDDLLLVPQFSTTDTRSKIDTAVELPKGFKFKHPLIPANMSSITEFEMAKCIAETGGLAIIHRFMHIDEQLMIARKLSLLEVGNLDYLRHVGFSVGVKLENYSDVDKLVDAGIKILCIDIAHGDSLLCINMCQYIAQKYPDILLIAGNVATGSGAERLWVAGADVVKSGVGPGSLCSTRIQTGNGVPQLTAIMDVYNRKQELTKSFYKKASLDEEETFDLIASKIKRKISFIADGGIKNSGDCVKALCFADMVMTGRLFAGSTQTPGELIIENDMAYKEYNGSSTHKKDYIEGVKAKVEAQGDAKDIIKTTLEGIRSGMSYQGVSNLMELKESPQFVRISTAGYAESIPHVRSKL